MSFLSDLSSSQSISNRRGSTSYVTAEGLLPVGALLQYQTQPPEPKEDLLCMKSANAMHMGVSYHEFIMVLENGFLSVHENVGTRIAPKRGPIKERVYLRDAVVEIILEMVHDVKVHTLVLVSKPPESFESHSPLPTSLHSRHWRHIEFRTSPDPKLTDSAITTEWEVAIQKHIIFYNSNGIILTPDPGMVYEISREPDRVDAEEGKCSIIFVNVCSHRMMPHKLKRGKIKEKHMRLICGPERILKGRTGVYNVIDVVVEEEVIELCLENMDIKTEVCTINCTTLHCTTQHLLYIVYALIWAYFAAMYLLLYLISVWSDVFSCALLIFTYIWYIYIYLILCGVLLRYLGGLDCHPGAEDTGPQH
jgi:hypothetical protein